MKAQGCAGVHEDNCWSRIKRPFSGNYFHNVKIESSFRVSAAHFINREFVLTTTTMASTYANTRAILQFAEGKAFAQRMAPPTANGTCAGRRPPVCSCSTLAFTLVC
jgi:hypothetical protein